MPVRPIPDGFRSVTPYLVLEGVAQCIDFVKQTFDAEELERVPGPNNTVMHAEIKIGDCVVMMGEASGENKPIPAMLYVYVDDVDAVYKRALDAGGVSVQAPADQFYGDRNSIVTDSVGNTWMIATHVEDVPPDEMAKRAQAAMQQKPGNA